MELTLKIPSHINTALKLPDQGKEQVLLTELALILYEKGMLSFGKARALAEISKWDFDALLSKQKIERHYDLESFEEDFAYGKT